MDLSQIKGSDYLAMDPAEQAKVLTEIYRTVFFEDVKGWSVYGIDLLEELGVNDYAEGHARMELPLGLMNTCIAILHQCFVEQNRAELQCLSKDTEFTANLSTQIYDTIDTIKALTDELINLQTYYFAGLKHRKESNRHLINAEGDTVPFSKEELAKDAKVKAERDKRFKQQLEQQRAELEAVYWGTAQPPELDEGYSTAQLPLPLWSVGFRPEEQGN